MTTIYPAIRPAIGPAIRSAFDGYQLSLTQRIRALFSASEPGAWYDPSDMSTLFQDSAGTTPVTAVEQPVGRILDKSGRGNHATQATTTKRPVLQQDGNGKYYLAFDGVDDSMATGAINFTSTDKMTVWAGVTALDMGRTSGVANQLLYSNGDNYNGFGMRTPNSPSSITFVSSGSIGLAEPSEVGLGVAPRSMVICGVGDQSAPLSQLRRDGVLRGFSTAAQGASGGYGNRAMWIGSHAGNLRFFKGRLYSLIVRGAQTPLSQIEATERYIKQKMRLP